MNKKALKLALEALESERDKYLEWGDEDGAPDDVYEAITAIKQALEQPVQEPVGRTDQQIVDQTEELAGFLMRAFHRQEKADPLSTFRGTQDIRAQHCWQTACQIQEMLTATDPENAVAELDVEATPPAQPATVQEPVAHLWKHSQTGRTRIVMPGGIITADAAWFVVGPLVLGNTTPPAAQPTTEDSSAVAAPVQSGLDADCIASVVSQRYTTPPAAQQCKWPTCQSEENQQALAEQIKQELVTGTAQPEWVPPAEQRPWVDLTDKQCGAIIRHHSFADDIIRVTAAKLKELNT